MSNLGINVLTPKGDRGIWPNPVSDELYISNAVGSEVCIYDLVGKEVYRANILSDKENVYMGFLASGVYVLQIVDPATGQRTTKKIEKK